MLIYCPGLDSRAVINARTCRQLRLDGRPASPLGPWRITGGAVAMAAQAVVNTTGQATGQ